MLQDRWRGADAAGAGDDWGTQSAEAGEDTQPEPSGGSPKALAAAPVEAASSLAAADVTAFVGGGGTSSPREGGRPSDDPGGVQPPGGAELSALQLQLEAALAEVLTLRSQRDEALQQVIQGVWIGLHKT